MMAMGDELLPPEELDRLRNLHRAYRQQLEEERRQLARLRTPESFRYPWRKETFFPVRYWSPRQKDGSGDRENRS